MKLTIEAPKSKDILSLRGILKYSIWLQIRSLIQGFDMTNDYLNTGGNFASRLNKSSESDPDTGITITVED